MNIKTFKLIYLLLIPLTAFLIYLDFIRDYIFQNLNLQIHYLSHHIDGVPNIDNYTDSFMEDLLDGINIFDVVELKYISLLVFVIFYYLISVIYGLILFRDNIKRFSIFTFLLFVLVISLSALMYFLSMCFPGDIAFAFYNISMELSHFVQSSLIVITMLISYFIFLPTSKQKIKNKNG